MIVRFFYDKTYPVISIVALQIGKYINTTEHMMKIAVFGLQIIIGVLTICKLYSEIKKRKHK